MAENYIDSDLQNDSKMVLFFEQRPDPINNFQKIDATCFVLAFDEEHFIVYGRRKFNKMPPFVFNLKKNEIKSFLKLYMGPTENFSVSCYNYNNIIDMDWEEINFEFLESLVNEDYEVFAYDNQYFYSAKTKDNIKNMLQILDA
jgi:hypothetical protein